MLKQLANLRVLHVTPDPGPSISQLRRGFRGYHNHSFHLDFLKYIRELKKKNSKIKCMLNMALLAPL